MTNTEQYKGLVLADGEHNGYHDSDFYAIVWNPETKRATKIITASTRYAGGFLTNGRDVPENVWDESQRRFFQPRAYLRLLHAQRAASRKVEKGKKVKVVGGRKVKHGTEGVVFYMKELTFSPRFRNGYKQGPDTTKIGIALDNERDAQGRYKNVAWTYVRNVEVVNPEQYVNKRELWEKVKTSEINPRAFFHSYGSFM